MIHIRAVSPADATPGLVDSLASKPGILNLVVLEGVARNPDGDALEFDVINAEANGVLGELRGRGITRRGSVVIEDVGATLSERATRAGSPAPRAPQPGADMGRSRRQDPRRRTLPAQLVRLLAIAGLIAAVGIFTNSQILVVGAMVVGPEYAAIISIARAIDKHDRRPIRAGMTALVVGFLIAIVVTFVFSLIVRAFGWEPEPSVSASDRCPT